MICEACANFSIYIGHGATRKPDDPEIASAVFAAQMDLL